MNIEKLIERLRTESLYKDKATLEIMDLCMDAATALATLQAENEKLRAELDEKEKYYGQMIDALAATDRAELEQAKRERDDLERFLGELEGAVYTGQYFHLRPMIEKWRGQKED